MSRILRRTAKPIAFLILGFALSLAWTATASAKAFHDDDLEERIKNQTENCVSQLSEPATQAVWMKHNHWTAVQYLTQAKLYCAALAEDNNGSADRTPATESQASREFEIAKKFGFTL